MKKIFVLGMLSAAACAQNPLPNAPAPQLIQPWALNVGLSQRYSITKDTNAISLTGSVDWRFAKRWRAGFVVSHELQTNTNSLYGTLNVKVLEWGKPVPIK